MIEHKVPAVKIHFHGLTTLILEQEYYDKIGKFKGVLKEFAVSIKQVKEVEKLLLKPSEFPTQEWQG